jgi:hypothetical protein
LQNFGKIKKYGFHAQNIISIFIWSTGESSSFVVYGTCPPYMKLLIKRDDFVVTRDGEGALYAYKVKDELTKNHQTDDAKSKGRMYEIKGNLTSTKT